jgi:AcrR family transcriptional regulator
MLGAVEPKKTVPNARQRVREAVRADIVSEARSQMAEVGAGMLSLRSVARELGMASSAMYRYFASRDELLTALIIEAYDSVGDAVDAVESTQDKFDFTGRWRACCLAVREWALEHPHEYALIYGSPVPGYIAPENTTLPASRVTQALVAVIRDAAASGQLANPFGPGLAPPLSKAAALEAAHVEARGLFGVPKDAIVRAVIAWTQLFGIVSFELFGRFDDVVDDRSAVFDQSVNEMSAFVGFAATVRAPKRRGASEK